VATLVQQIKCRNGAVLPVDPVVSLAEEERR
jgi:hypothetical protein